MCNECTKDHTDSMPSSSICCFYCSVFHRCCSCSLLESLTFSGHRDNNNNKKTASKIFVFRMRINVQNRYLKCAFDSVEILFSDSFSFSHLTIFSSVSFWKKFQLINVIRLIISFSFFCFCTLAMSRSLGCFAPSWDHNDDAFEKRRRIGRLLH